MNPQAFDSLGGIPSHPLLVHLPVVLVPVAMLLMILSLWPKVRTSALWGSAIAAVGGFIGAVLAAGSGESLEHAVKRSDLLRKHTELGDQVQGYAGVFAVLAIVALVIHLSRTDALPFAKVLSPVSKRIAPLAKALSPVSKRVIPFAKRLSAGAVASVIAFVSVVGVVATWQTYNAGHSGAKAVWNGTKITDMGGDDD